MLEFWWTSGQKRKTMSMFISLYKGRDCESYWWVIVLHPLRSPESLWANRLAYGHRRRSPGTQLDRWQAFCIASFFLFAFLRSQTLLFTAILRLKDDFIKNICSLSCLQTWVLQRDLNVHGSVKLLSLSHHRVGSGDELHSGWDQPRQARKPQLSDSPELHAT